ncbi:DUF429 domain-containing protein [Halolamina sediminis]|uniref:DUF429 domain-containing protein n=1 Tax=Halolamina sediminis TaxID=1480675 RepID=UPI0006B5165F|nr:DUF429 domain-containing protein [Halolamina sediminis]
MDPERVYGVDFSGAQDAERNVWIAGGPLKDDGVQIETLGSGRELLSDASGREATHDALVDWLRERESAAVGLDFSFGLPSTLLDAMEDSPGHWTVFLDAFPPAGCADPGAFEEWGKERTRRATDGDRAFLKRETDTPVGASSPYGFIGSTITFYGIRDVLAPLVRGSDGGEAVATVAPMQTSTFEPPLTLLETYPAGVLDDLGLQRRNYKGASDAERAARRENLEGLTSSVDVSVYDDDRTTIVDDTGGDALDAVVAAAATYRAVDGDFAHDENHYDEREGDIYV